DIVAMKYAVPHDTARRWKTQAMKNGDDWDKLRAAHALAGDGLESVARTVLISLVVKCQTTLERLNQNRRGYRQRYSNQQRHTVGMGCR
ncbi:DUF1804 family protein, partial [Escherichia coli]